VYGIVKQSGGSINLYSEPGHGTTFKVYLPRLFEPAEERAVATEEPVERQAEGTILVAEDEETVRGIAVLALSRAGYEVLAADSGPMAIEVASAHPGPINLLVADVVLGPMSGLQLSKELTRLRPGIRTLFVSGYAENTIVHHGVLDPQVAFLPKPFTPGALVRKVGEVLAEARAEG
jgi:CheY-like chemotaxis protein